MNKQIEVGDRVRVTFGRHGGFIGVTTDVYHMDNVPCHGNARVVADDGVSHWFLLSRLERVR